MKNLQAAGLVVAGAAFGLGSAFLMGGDDPQPVAEQSAIIEPAAEADVTRQAADPLTLNTISRLNEVVSKSQEPLKREEDLTPEQLEVIAFFERTARELNEGDQARSGGIWFNNMSIDKLKVEYFYTIGDRFTDIDPVGVLATQAELVQDNICNDVAIQTLIRDFGFEYHYRFVTNDYKYVGEVKGDIKACEA